MAKALLLENIHPDAAQSLRDHGFEVETRKGALGEKELIEALDGVSLLGIRSKTSVTAAVIDACPSLTAVGCFCIGTNQVDLDYAGKHGIGVFNARIPTPVPWWTGDLRHHLPDAPHSRPHASHAPWLVGQVRFRLA